MDGKHNLYEDFQIFRRELQSGCDDTCSKTDPRIVHAMKQQTDGVIGMNQFYGIEVMQEFGHQEVPFIVSCSKTYTNGMTSLFLPCNGTIEFTRQLHPQLLNCYSTDVPMYNYDVSVPDGLSFILFLDNLYLSNFSGSFNPHADRISTGVKLDLSAKMEIPFSSTKNTFLNAGMYINIGKICMYVHTHIKENRFKLT